MRDSYERLRSIGKGAFGTASLVRRIGTRKRYVAKELKVDGTIKYDLAGHEWTVISRLQHENIIRFVDGFDEGDRVYILTEYASAGDLKRILDARKRLRAPFSELAVRYLLRNIARGLEHLHRKRIVHRDVKAANIFLTSDGCVKIGDFGLSVVLHPNDTLTGTCGTPLNFCPEMCLGGVYDEKADMWALGCLLFQIMNLEHPFEAPTREDIFKRILSGDYRDPDPANLYSHDLRWIVNKLLSRDPAQRPSAAQLLLLPAFQRVDAALVANVVTEITSTTARETKIGGSKNDLPRNHWPQELSSATKCAQDTGSELHSGNLLELTSADNSQLKIPVAAESLRSPFVARCRTAVTTARQQMASISPRSRLLPPKMAHCPKTPSPPRSGSHVGPLCVTPDAKEPRRVTSKAKVPSKFLSF